MQQGDAQQAPGTAWHIISSTSMQTYFACSRFTCYVPFSSGILLHELQRYLEDIYLLVFKCHISYPSYTDIPGRAWYPQKVLNTPPPLCSLCILCPHNLFWDVSAAASPLVKNPLCLAS